MLFISVFYKMAYLREAGCSVQGGVHQIGRRWGPGSQICGSVACLSRGGKLPSVYTVRASEGAWHRLRLGEGRELNVSLCPWRRGGARGGAGGGIDLESGGALPSGAGAEDGLWSWTGSSHRALWAGGPGGGRGGWWEVLTGEHRAALGLASQQLPDGWSEGGWSGLEGQFQALALSHGCCLGLFSSYTGKYFLVGLGSGEGGKGHCPPPGPPPAPPAGLPSRFQKRRGWSQNDGWHSARNTEPEKSMQAGDTHRAGRARAARPEGHANGEDPCGSAGAAAHGL